MPIQAVRIGRILRALALLQWVNDWFELTGIQPIIRLFN